MTVEEWQLFVPISHPKHHNMCVHMSVYTCMYIYIYNSILHISYHVGEKGISWRLRSYKFIFHYVIKWKHKIR